MGACVSSPRPEGHPDPAQGGQGHPAASPKAIPPPHKSSTPMTPPVQPGGQGSPPPDQAAYQQAQHAAQQEQYAAQQQYAAGASAPPPSGYVSSPAPVPVSAADSPVPGGSSASPPPSGRRSTGEGVAAVSSSPSEPEAYGQDVVRAPAVTQARRGALPSSGPPKLPPSARPMDARDVPFVAECLTNALLFSRLDEATKDGIVRRMYELPVKAGEVLIREGSPGEELYVVKSGSFEVLQRRRGASVRVNEKRRGDVFGEIALMYDTPRTASVVATADAVVWGLHRESFRQYVHEVRADDSRKIEVFLNSVGFIKDLSERDRLRLVDALTPETFEQGAVVVREGDPGDRFYIVKEGQAAVWKQQPDGTKRRVNQLYPTDFFGEAALIDDSPRTATVEASTRLSVLSVNRHDFVTLFGPLQDAMKRAKDPELTARKMDKLRSRGAPGRDHADVFVRRRLPGRNAAAGGRDGRDGGSLGSAIAGAFSHLSRHSGSAHAHAHAHAGAGAPSSPDPSSPASLLEGYSVVRCRGHADEVAELMPIVAEDASRASAVGVPAPASEVARAAALAAAADAVADPALSAPSRVGSSAPRIVLTEGGVLGGGAFSRVCVSDVEGTGRRFALKRMKKTGVVQCPEHVYWEQTIGRNVVHPFCLRQYGSFQDRGNLYFVTDLALGGDLMDVLVADAKVVLAQRRPDAPPSKMLKGLEEHVARFYLASLVLALEYLHDHSIVYRDLKPENVFLDADGFIKLGDFGFAKLLEHGRKTYTFCGTPGYVAPENVLAQGYGFSVDWWGLGVLAYVLLTGRQPFTSPKTDDPMVVMRRIVDEKFVVQYPPYVSPAAKDLIARLLERRPAWRLGMLQGRAGDIKRHPFFAGVDWQALEAKRVQPPRKPKQDAAKRLKEMEQQEAKEEPNVAVTPEEAAACDSVFADF